MTSISVSIEPARGESPALIRSLSVTGSRSNAVNVEMGSSAPQGL